MFEISMHMIKMKNCLALFFYLIISSTVYAQVDSLKVALHETDDDKDRVVLIIALGKAYLDINPSEAIHYYSMGVELGKKLGSNLDLINSLKGKGTGFFYLSQYDSTEFYWKKALARIPSNKKLLKADLINNLGILFQRKGLIDSSLVFHKRAFHLRKELPDTSLIAQSHYNLAGLYRVKGQFGEALKHYFLALKTYEAFNLVKEQSDALNGIGLTYMDLKKTDQSLLYLKKALKIRKTINNPRLIASSTNNIAANYKLKEDYLTAKKYYLEYLELAEKLLDKRGIAGVYSNLGGVEKSMGNIDRSMEYYKFAFSGFKEMNEPSNIAMVATNIGALNLWSSHYTEALEYYLIALEYAEQTSSLSIKKTVHKGLSDTYEYLKLFDKANEHLKEYAELKDQMFNQSLSSQISKYQELYEAEKRAKEIQILKNDKVRIENEAVEQEKRAIEREKKLEQAKIYRNGAIIVSILTIAMLFMLYNRFALRRQLFAKEAQLHEREKEEYRLKAELKQKEIDSKNRELSSMASNALHKNELLLRLQNSVNNVKRNIDNKEVNELDQLIKNGVDLDSDWNLFQQHFTSVHPNFFIYLRKNYPKLTANDLRICAYLRMNLSNKEIASLMNIETKSVRMNRYRLKKKLDLPEDMEVQNFMFEI